MGDCPRHGHVCALPNWTGWCWYRDIEKIEEQRKRSQKTPPDPKAEGRQEDEG